MAQLTINRRDKTVQFSDLISLSSLHKNIEHDIVQYDNRPVTASNLTCSHLFTSMFANHHAYKNCTLSNSHSFGDDTDLFSCFVFDNETSSVTSRSLLVVASLTVSPVLFCFSTLFLQLEDSFFL